MANQRHLISNVYANIGQTIAGVVLLFALYRYINVKLGVDQLGVWSVVLATVSASRLADLGLSASVLRFVAGDLAKNNFEHAVQVIDTVTLTLALLIGLMLPLAYWLIDGLLPHLFVAEHLIQAKSILPYALISLWLTMLAAVFQGGLEGSLRMDARAALVVGGQALMLLLAIWWVPQRGLLGLAWAQIGQGFFLLLGGRLLLCRVLPGLQFLPQRGRVQVLKEIYGYSANVQAATLFMMLFDPVTKALMARFGGANIVGYFEMANQVVMKVRSVIVTANQAVVPHVAGLTMQEPENLSEFYQINMRILMFVTLPAFALLSTWSGAVSQMLTGQYQPELILLLNLLAMAWMINIFSGPAYFFNLGTGHVGRNTFAHVIMGSLNVALGWMFGTMYGPQGVALAYAIALIISSVILIIMFHHRYRLNASFLVKNGNLGLITACMIVVVIGWIKPIGALSHGLSDLSLGLVLPLILVGLAAWHHPMRKQFLDRLTARTT